MLQAIRERAQGIFAWVMLLVIGVPFALWGIQNYVDTGKEAPVATVGDREFFDRDVNRVYEQSLSNLIGIADYDEKKLKAQALDRLINEELLAQTAEEESLAAGDDEVRQFIQTLPYFQTEGKFDKAKYKMMLASQGMSAAQFASQIRRALITEQLQNGVAGSAFATRDQIESMMKLKHQEREIQYVTLPMKASSRDFGEAEQNAYYQGHLDDFRIPEKVSVDYLSVSLDELAKGTQVSDEELTKYYEEQKASFGTPERRRISHILIVADGKDAAADQAAQAKATEVKARIVKGEDFAKLAAEVSADTVSSKKGGDLGYLEKGAQDESFYKAASELPQGGVSDPVKTSFGYHIIRLTELTPASVKPFEQVKDEIRKTVQHNAAETKFYELGQKLTEQTFEHPDSLEPAARMLGLAVQQTALFTKDAGEGLGAEEAVRKAAFSEEVLGGRNSDPVELGNDKAVVLRVRDHQPASVKPLSEVVSAVVAKLKEQDARQEATERARTALQQAQEGKALDEVAKAAGLTVSKAGFVQRENDKLPPELVRSVFRAARPVDGKPAYGSVALANGDQIVYALTAVKDGAVAADNKDDKDRSAARDFLLRSEGQRELGAYMKRLRELADVVIKEKE